MSTGESTAEALEEIFQSILATPNHQRKLKSWTFWKKLGFDKRTQPRVEGVLSWLQQRHVIVNLRRRHSMLELANRTFGSEDKDDWVVLHYLQPASPQAETPTNLPSPGTTPLTTDARPSKMVQRTYVSEADVLCLFVFRLFGELGYDDADFAFQHTVEITAGRKEKPKKADLVLFDGGDHVYDRSLIVIETKKPQIALTQRDVKQARSYAQELRTPYYVLTNGDEVKVYLVRVGVEDAVVLQFAQSQLEGQWDKVYAILGKKSALAKKKAC